MKELGAAFTDGHSALCVLIRKATPHKVLEELKAKGFKGKVFKTSLNVDKEGELKNRGSTQSNHRSRVS